MYLNNICFASDHCGSPMDRPSPIRVMKGMDFQDALNGPIYSGQGGNKEVSATLSAFSGAYNDNNGALCRELQDVGVLNRKCSGINNAGFNTNYESTSCGRG
ncbi:MAG: hypothetical protein JEZ11_25315 [Desulfobacterales bacterium]|nr:hypothetical protein [Desulfobacterales bacterium]